MKNARGTARHRYGGLARAPVGYPSLRLPSAVSTASHASKSRTSVTWLLLFFVIGLGCCVFLSPTAFAGPTKMYSARERPSITSSTATFNVPVSGAAVWTLRLWTYGARLWTDGTLLGQSSGDSGILAVTRPVTKNCWFQADVLVEYPGRLPHFYSGDRETVRGCATAATTTTQPAVMTTTSAAGPLPTTTTTPSPTTTSVVAPTTSSTSTATHPGSSDAPSRVTSSSSASLALTGAGPWISLLAAVGSGFLLVGGVMFLGFPGKRLFGQPARALWQFLMRP